MTFSKNCAANGGAIIITHSSIHISAVSFGGNLTVFFTDNVVTGNGGIVHADKSNITFHGHLTVTFSRNCASSGGAIGKLRIYKEYGIGKSYITVP